MTFFFVLQNTITPSTPKHISLQAISCLNRPPQTKYLCTNVLVKLFELKHFITLSKVNNIGTHPQLNITYARTFIQD
jgi:hypothetical protein